MRKSLKVLAAATAMTMAMSFASYAAPVIADPGTKYPFTTIDANGTTVEGTLGYWHLSEAEVRALGANFGGYLDGLIRSAQTLSPGCDIHYIAESHHYTDTKAWGPQKLVGVAGADVSNMRQTTNDEVRQAHNTLVGENLERMFLGYTAPRYKYTLNVNGVPAEYSIYAMEVQNYRVAPDSVIFTDIDPSLYNYAYIYAVAVPQGYAGDISFIGVPFGWSNTYTGSTNTMEGIAQMIGTNSKARLDDAIQLPITGSQVKANTTAWDAQSLATQAYLAIGTPWSIMWPY